MMTDLTIKAFAFQIRA